MCVKLENGWLYLLLLKSRFACYSVMVFEYFNGLTVVKCCAERNHASLDARDAR